MDLKATLSAVLNKLSHRTPAAIWLLLAAALTAVASVGAAAGSAPSGPVRFTLRPAVIDPTQSLAQPGNVPLPAFTNQNLEILDWTTAPVTNGTGEFTLVFRDPTRVGSVVVYGASSVAWRATNTWHSLAPGAEAGRRLQFLALPAGSMAEAIRVTVSAPNGQRATLPFLALIPVSVANLAPLGEVSVSRTRGDARTLVDGSVEPAAGLEITPASATNDAWVILQWPQPRLFRGVALFHGAGPQIESPAVEFFVGQGDPRASCTTNDWVRSTLLISDAGAFRANRFIVLKELFDTRTLRVRASRAFSLSEVAVLQDLNISLPTDLAPKPGGLGPTNR